MPHIFHPTAFSPESHVAFVHARCASAAAAPAAAELLHIGHRRPRCTVLAVPAHAGGSPDSEVAHDERM